MRSFVPIVGLVLGLSAGCDRSDSGSVVDRPAGVNVVLFTLDTTRADRLGCYGSPKGLTPAIDALARDGVLFRGAFTPVPITLPAHISMLTGVYPPEHGVRVNGVNALGPEPPTLAELLGGRGYRTAAFVASLIVGRKFGLDRGFELYSDAMGVNEAGQARLQRPANEIADAALSWLSQVKDERFFVWVHFYDPHTPYDAPPEYVERSSDPYDAEVAFMDTHLGRIVDWLRAAGLLQNTLIVAVADHGESLGEHGYREHSLLLYNSIVWTPLIFHMPGAIAGGLKHEGVVELVDVTPTILDLLGFPAPELIGGESLLPALHGRDLPPRSAYLETDFPNQAYGWSGLRGLVEDRWHYIRAPAPELYDRLVDPGQLNNLAQTHPDVIERLDGLLTQREEQMATYTAGDVQLDAFSSQALRSLGYIGGATSSPESGELKNPMEHLHLVRDYETADELVNVGRLDEAITLLEAIVAASPESLVIHLLLATAYERSARPADAQGQYQAALTLAPDDSGIRLKVAEAAARAGQPAVAVATLRAGRERRPKDQDLAKALAWLLATHPSAEIRDGQEAVRLAEFVCNETSFRNPEHLDVLAAAYAETGRYDEAVSTLQRALALVRQMNLRPMVPLLQYRLQLYQSRRPFHWQEAATSQESL